MSERTAVIDVITARERDLGGFSVRRVLPSPHRRHVGPFVFLDHMGPVALPPGQGMDVRPHPHVNLATVTYLFEGEILHRDSLGSEQPIRPGDVNWMTAGSGIVHSERTPPELRAAGPKLHGLQMWIALPLEHEETRPTFVHHPKASLPKISRDGVNLHVVAGTAYGETSPVATLSPTFYVAADLPAGATLAVPEHEEAAVYVVDGAIRTNDLNAGTGDLSVFLPGAERNFTATKDTRAVLLGGASLGERHVYWNFVSSSRERIERAKADWREGRFPRVPGDDVEFIPLPDE
ncbi:MAG TPA: pirin family protein [Polyangiaceae bacterium]|nr:pirin family protein [Polyangiaceae bacterium]